jgi:ABC-type Fe3+-hydroxamate transport system substrate-binding protein
VGTAGHETTAGSVVAEAGGRNPEDEEGTAGGPPSPDG